MANRAKNAQYAYGITIEAGNYNEVINGFEKRLKDLDKSAKTTTATFKALSDAMKSGKQVDFGKAESQLTGLVAEMEEVSRWRDQLAGGQKLSDMFDGLNEVKQNLGQITSQLDKFGGNIEEIYGILQNVPQNVSKTFVDIRKVLQRQASDMSKIIAELNNPTEKTDISALKNQLSSLASDFANEWNRATSQGIKMDQVVDFKPFANTIKSVISGARSLGSEFNDVSNSVLETTKNVAALYNVKHPTGMFKDIVSGMTSIETQSKKAEQAASKVGASFKAAISIIDKLNKSDMGLAKKSREMDEFLAKLKNPEITIDLKNKDVEEEFQKLTDIYDDIVGFNNITPDFLKNLPTDKLKELGTTLQNIVAIGKEFPEFLDIGDDISIDKVIGDYESDLKRMVDSLKTTLNEASELTKELSSNLQQMLKQAGLKDIKLELGVPAEDEIDAYIGKINSFIDKIATQANRIKKIPVTLAFNKNEQNDAGVNALKDQFDNLKKIIHDARTEISQDTREIKQKILDAFNVNTKDMINVRAALEDAFNIEPLEILINDEFLVNQIQNALKNKTYDISLNANINGANYSNVGIPVSGVGGSIPATQQVATADKQERASDGQSKAAEKQKSAAQTNDKSAQLLSKASQEMTAFVKKFANTYYNAQRQQKELNSKVSSGETLTDKEQRRLSRVSGVVKNLNPIHEYLKGIFGDKVDLSKITEESMSKVLTSLMQSNGKGSFKGELLSEDLLGLLTGLKGKYRSKYGNGIGDLLDQLVGKSGKNGTLDAMFKSFGLTSATFNQTSSRDYTAPDVLKYYQSFARLADIIDSIKMNPQNVSNELLTELANILKGMQSRTTSEEYRANITEIGNSINALATNIKDYSNKIAATVDLDTKEGEDYTPLLNMFKEFYSNIDEATKNAISSAIGTNPSENIIKGDQLIKAKETISNMSGEAASSKIANDLLRWLDRMIAGDNVILSRETLLSQLGKGQKGSGLKVATSKNGKGKMTAYGMANNVLSDLDADIYYDGMGHPIVINRKDSPTQKRKSLRMAQNLGAKGRRLVNGTQIYTKDNPRPKFEDERRLESSIEGTIDWGKRLSAIDAELAKTSSEYEDAIKKRNETIQQIEQREQEVSKQIEIARKNVEEAKVNLSDVSKGTDVQESVDINNIKSSIRDREKLYNLMVEMDKSYIPDFELSKKGIPVSDSYKQLIEERKKVESRIKAAKGTSDFYKNIENGTSEDKSRYIKATETKVSEIESALLQLNNQLIEAEKTNDTAKIKYYKNLIVDKTNELDSARNKLNNYKKIESGKTVSTEYDSKVAEQENILVNINTQINEELDSQKKQMDKDTYYLLLKFIEQYKERQNKLKGLEKDLSKYKEGSKEHDNILIQIDSLKTNLNSMVDEISQISSTLGLDNKDLENAFSGMSSEEFFSSKDARRKLEKEVEALSTFKKDSLANVSIFPDELKDLIQRRNELLYEKSDISNDKETLKKLKDGLRSVRERGSKQDIEFYKERVKIISEKINEARPTKEINSEIKEIDAIIAQYIKSKVTELKQLSKTKFNKNTVSKYEVGGSTSGKYQKDISDKSSILAQLEQEARLLVQNKEAAKSDVVSLENKRKVLEKQRELAQLQVNYNTKRMEELQLTEEIASLEKSDPSSDVLEQKKKQLESVNAELSKMYAQIHNAGSTTSFETLDESLSADKKKLIALEKIIEAQKIIAQNEEMQNRSRAKIKDASGISNIKLDNETGKFTTLYGNESKLTRSTSDRFRSLYTKSEGFIQFRNDLYAKAREKIASIQDSISQKVSDAIDSMSKDAIGKIVQSKYGENGLKAHEKSWGISIETLDRELRDAIEKRSNSIYEEYNEYVNNILASNLNPAQKNDKITAALTARDSKMSSLYSGGTEFQAIFAKKAKKFQEYYYETLSNLLTLSGKSEDGLDKEFLKSIKAQFNQLTLVKGKGKDAPETAFGKKVSNILNQADEKSDDIIKRIYNAVDRKLEENILSYMKEISADETRLEGELANDVVFKDKLGNRINLAAEYRNANKYNLDRVTNLGQENKAQREWIAKLREYGGISDEEMKYIQEAKERALLKLYDGSQSDIKNLDILIGDIDTTPVENATKNIADKVVMAGAKAAEEAVESKLSTTVTPETAPVQQAEQKVAEQVVNNGLEGLNISGISDERMSELVDMALKKKSDLISKEIEGRQSKSKPLNTSDKQKDLEYVFDKGTKSSQEFAEAIFKMVDAIEAGKNVANVEYGFTERNGKRVELATGDIDSVYYDKLSGVIDSMTHSHAYKKGTNNMMFSLADMKQMRNLAEENELSKYSLIYGKEMMSMNLGKDSLKTARAVAQKYPIINDVVTAMFATADGESVAAENSGEMARILNGYLQRVISEAGGELSVTNSSGLDVSSKYSITDDEYTKLNNVVSNFKNYFDNNYGKVTNLGEYTKVIKEYLSKEFGKNFIDGIVNKEYDKSKGGIGTEYSAEKQDDWQKLLSLFSRSKRLTENEQAVYDRLVSMPIDQLIAEKQKIDAAISANKEPEIKPTLTKAQIAALNPDDTTALQKASINQFKKIRNWNEGNVGNFEEFLGADNKKLVAYKTQYEELAKIALDLKTKGEAGTIITKEDISQLDSAITKTKELQTALTKEAQYKQLKDAGLIVNGKTKIKPTDTYSDRQAIMAEYAKKYAAQNKSEYQFGQYDFINDKISFNMIDSAGKVTKAVMGWSDAFNTAYIQSSKLHGSLDKITQEIYKTDEAIKAGEDYGFFKEQSDGVKEYNDALKEYEEQVRAVAKSSQKDLDKNFEALHAAQVKVINAGKNLLDKQKDAFGFNSAQKVLGREGNVDAVLQNYRDQGINVNDIELVKNYNDAIRALKQKLDELKQSGKLWDSNEQAGLKVLADHAAEAEKAILKADEAQRQLKGDLITGAEAKFFEGVDPKDIKQVEQAMKQYAQSIEGVDAQSIKWNEEQRTLTYSVRTGKHEVSDFALTMGEYTNACYKARTGTRTVQTGMEKFLTSIKGKFQEVARYIISFGSFYRIWAEIQKGVTYVREIDSALTELKKVTDETDETYEKFLDTASKVGSEIGSTIADFTNATADFARLGYSIEEATKLAEAASIYKNVGDGIDSVSQATESIISTIKAFGIEAENSMSIVDKFNEVGNNFAISSTGIGEALQRSASALYESGNTLDESIALITAANSVIQNPEQVGTALKTLSLRLRGAKVELEEAGEDVDGMADSVSSLQQKLLALTHGKVDIMADASTFKNTTQILREMSKAWEDMTDIERSAALELMGGKRQANILASIIKNYDTVDSVIEASINSQNSAYEENLKWMDSIEGRINKFTNALQSMWKNAINSDAVKNIISFGTAIIELIDKVGLLPSILTAASAALSAFKGQNLFFNLNKDSSGKLGIITELIQKLKEGAPALKEFNSIQGVENQVKFLNSLKETNPELAKYITKVMSASSVTTANGVATNIASASQAGYTKSLIASKIATIALNVATVALNAALTMGISLLVSGLITAVSKWINKTKEEKEETRKLTEELKQQQSQIKSNISSLESLKDEFNELSKGVDEYGNNISLSTEEYAKYKSIVEEILGYTPTLISGYDKEGNAIANKNGLIEKSIALLKEERKQKLLDLVADDKIKAAYDSAKENYEKNKPGIINVPDSIKYSGVKIDNNGKEKGGYANLIDKYIEDVIGVKRNEGEFLSQYIARNYDAVRENIGAILKRSGETKDGWKGLDQSQQAELLNYLNNVLSSVREADSAWDSFIQTLQLVPELSNYYDDLSDSQKNFISSYINSLGDLSSKTEAEINQIKPSILSLVNAIGNSDVAKNLIEQLFSLDSSLSAKEYADRISEIFTSLVNEGIISDETKEKITEQMFPDLDRIAEMQEKIKESIQEGQKDAIDGLNMSDLKVAYQVVMELDQGSLLSFNQLLDAIERKKAEAASFDISNYATSIESITGNISTFQGALSALESGTFSMSDFIGLLQQFPDIAKGVSVANGKFVGLDKNLRRLIKDSPKSLIADLKKLREQLKLVGKDTSAIDALIDSMENLPIDVISDLGDEYLTLADNINAAKKAQTELEKAMGEDTNTEYTTYAEGYAKMQELMEKGAVGSESKLWKIAETIVGKDDPIIIQKDADALWNLIEARKSWYDGATEDGYSYDGISNFLEYVSQQEDVLSQFPEVIWEYENGLFTMKLPNDKWDEFAKSLHMTSEEFTALMWQAAQFHQIRWENVDDLSSYLDKMAESGYSAKDRLDDLERSLENMIGKSLDGLSRDDLKNLLVSMDMDEDSVNRLLDKYDQLKIEVSEDPLSIKAILDQGGEDVLSKLSNIAAIKDSINKTGGITFFDEQSFRNQMEAAGYAQTTIDQCVASIKNLQGVTLISKTAEDPLGLNGIISNAEDAATAVKETTALLQGFEGVVRSFNEGEIAISVTDLYQKLKESNYSPEKIQEYFNELSENGFQFTIDGENLIDDRALQAKLKELSEEKTNIPVTPEISQEGSDAIETWRNEQESNPVKITVEAQQDQDSFDGVEDKKNQLKETTSYNVEAKSDQDSVNGVKKTKKGLAEPVHIPVFFDIDKGSEKIIQEVIKDEYKKILLYLDEAAKKQVKDEIADIVKDEKKKILPYMDPASVAQCRSVIASLTAPETKTITVDVVYNDPGWSGGGSTGGGSTSGGSSSGTNKTSSSTNKTSSSTKKTSSSAIPNAKDKRRYYHADGTAHASGNWGLPQAEHNSLVGELGMETVKLIAVLIYLIAETS